MSIIRKIIQQRPLGSQGLMVSQQGVGCMGMTAYVGGDREALEVENLKTIATALELGINFFDTAWQYQARFVGGDVNETNEGLLGKAIKIHGRDKFIIATKFGTDIVDGKFITSGSEATIRSQLADSLQRLGSDYIDLYYMARMDPETPIEETMRVLKSLVEAGTIRYIGLSECTPAELRRAHAVHTISAIQMEWSLQTRSIEAELLPTARELGVGIVCYSPLGRGLLSGAVTSLSDLDAKDPRRRYPRFSEANLKSNAPIAAFLALAENKNCTPAQLALAWLHAQGDDVFPIPGTKSSHRVMENASAVNVKLTAEEAEEVAAAVPTPVGDRYGGTKPKPKPVDASLEQFKQRSTVDAVQSVLDHSITADVDDILSGSVTGNNTYSNEKPSESYNDDDGGSHSELKPLNFLPVEVGSKHIANYQSESSDEDSGDESSSDDDNNDFMRTVGDNSDNKNGKQDMQTAAETRDSLHSVAEHRKALQKQQKLLAKQQRKQLKKDDKEKHKQLKQERKMAKQQKAMEVKAEKQHRMEVKKGVAANSNEEKQPENETNSDNNNVKNNCSNNTTNYEATMTVSVKQYRNMQEIIDEQRQIIELQGEAMAAMKERIQELVQEQQQSQHDQS